MNIEQYNLDSLRKLVRELQKENTALKAQLEKAGLSFETEDIFAEKITDNEEYDLDQGSRIISKYIDDNLANRFFSMFWGRQDVYAKRAKNGNYYPQCDNRWNNLCPKYRGEKVWCDECENTKYTALTLQTIKNHLIGFKEDGTDVIGIYPLLPDGTCRFIVFDFDNHEKDAEKNDFANNDNAWHEEVDALRIMCEKNGIKPLVERSRSGRGAHVWIFFSKKIPASVARNFGFLLLDKGAASINLKTFHYYDRMYPTQDASRGIGNLIALPLQGQALKNGNSAFVDKNWNAFPDQWEELLGNTPKLSPEDIHALMVKWQSELAQERGMLLLPQTTDRPKPWKRRDKFSSTDVIGKLHIVLGNGLYIDTLNLMPRIQNQIRSLAAFDNPVFYKNKRLGYSNYYNFSAVYLGQDENGYIHIPRGLRERVIEECKGAGIEYDIEDVRSKGRPLRISFNGKLKPEQQLAADGLLEYDNGILSAATAFGKTVVCSYLIARKKVSTLILVQNKELLNQWVDELCEFLVIDEEPPTYTTPKGRIKKRDNVIGILHGNKNTLTGIIDIAMTQSLANKDYYDDILKSYGMIIMDECHHGASETAMDVLKKINAKYVYGVSATPKRGDDLEKIVYMLIGPVRHRFTAKERALQQGIGHYIYPRYTRVVDSIESRNDINGAYSLISNHKVRDEMIVSDIIECVSKKRTPVILTKQKDHAKRLYEYLQGCADNVYLLYGDNSDRENALVIETMRNLSPDQSMILVATGQKVGEGFNYPRLDTLMLAAPLSDPSRVEQYVGRLNRDYPGKKDVIVYDYIDAHIRLFSNMYNNRLKTYKRIGYEVVNNLVNEKQSVNAIYDSGNYTEIFERDLIEANDQVIISSPGLSEDKVDRLIYIMRTRQEAGVKVIVLTVDADCVSMGSSGTHKRLLKELNDAGILTEVREEIEECFAVIDDELVWHGGANLLGKEDAWDNLMRVKNPQIATELLEIAWQHR